MRKLAVPITNDEAVLDQLLRSHGKKAGLIRQHRDEMTGQYGDYVAARGDPWLLGGLAPIGSAEEQGAMIDLYKSKTPALGFIAELRDGTRGPCPMCGSGATGTLDHYLPKSSYAQFSFFSRNLIPCCAKCNSLRQDSVRGIAVDERAVHPYFDDFLDQRVMTATFQAPWVTPKVNLVPFNVQGQALLTVQWHIDNVIKPAGVVKDIIYWWGNLYRDPESVLRGATDIYTARENVRSYQRGVEVLGGSRNCWYSTFLHGLAAADEMLAALLAAKASQP
jgi:hypothetical protein